MDPVSNLGQVLAVLRRQISERSVALGGRATAHAPKPENGAAAEEMRDVQKKIQLRIRAIDADDARRQSKAVRIFLEGVLRREFGDAVINDSAFYALIDDVQAAMESDPGLNTELRDLIQRLIEEA